MQRTVGAHLVIDVVEPAELVFAIAVARDHDLGAEEFVVASDGRSVPVAETPDAHGTRLHRVAAPVGRLVVDYRAVVEGRLEPASVTASDRLIYLRPSRYAESDALAATAGAEFAGITRPADLLTAVSSWVGTRLLYLSGSSRPTDGAVQTLLARQGVCRDFAHLVTALLRARGVAARTVAVYAPGLDPMDFHAVVEADVDGTWCVVDSTRLAPTSSLVRICSGRDAADTAFLSLFGGVAQFRTMEVTATTAGPLPLPDDAPFPLA